MTVRMPRNMVMSNQKPSGKIWTRWSVAGSNTQLPLLNAM